MSRYDINSNPALVKLMKKLLMLMLILILGMCSMPGCSRNGFCRIKIGDSIDKAKDVYNSSYISLNALQVFKDEGRYVLAVEGNRGISGIAVFSSEGRLLYSEKLVPINDENIKRFCGESVYELEKQYGKIHCDIGSGFYLPAYITNHATIIFFEIRNDTVERFFSMDIITKETTEVCSES